MIEPFLTPDAFATIFCEDLGIGLSYKDSIVEQIKKQLQDWSNVAEISLQPEDAEEEEDVNIDLRVIVNVSPILVLIHLLIVDSDCYHLYRWTFR